MEVPGYRVRETIGRGGMATVYLAIQESLEREVVLKVLNADQSDSKDFMERFINEGRMIASLRHPHIITIFDIGSTDDVIYIAMEYVDGGDLKARLGERLPGEDALEILTNIAGALGYAHDQGIIHRDVKPANILFRGDGTVLLSDFGIAKQVQVDSELTSTGTILGSPFYMSPEQAEGLEVDGRTDIYSLGVIFHEMLVGERPYLGDSAIKVIMQHIQSPEPKLPEDLTIYQPVLDLLMAKDRDRRVPDATTLIEEVKSFRVKHGLVGDAGGVVVEMPPAPEEEPEASKEKSAAVLARILTSRNVTILLSAILILIGCFFGFYVYRELNRPPLIITTRPSPTVATPDAPAPATSVQSQNAAAGAPAVAPKGMKKRDVTRALSMLAKLALRDDRLTQPPADNAYYYYSRVLALDPGNEAARTGFTEIAERFVILAEEEFARKSYAKAQTYIALGLQVQPKNEALTTLQKFIENRKKSLIETFVDLFE